MLLYEEGKFRRVAVHNPPPAYAAIAEREPYVPPNDKTLTAILNSKRPIHIDDMASHSPQSPIAKFGGARTFVIVPMLKEEDLVGIIGIYRLDVRPFSDKQIALLSNFAAQAVIAIENTRLLNELRETLDRQTATSEVLQVISSSPGALEPVFEKLLTKATELCEANFGLLYRAEDRRFLLVAHHNTPQALLDNQRGRGWFEPIPGTTLDRIRTGRSIIHSADDAQEKVPSPSARLGGARSHLTVPMLKDEDLVGAIVIFRQEVRPFTDEQIELVQNFASQAVIAIENARLLNELRQRTVELESKGRELAEASRHKSQFLANMSHELRTPLNAILGYTELVLDGIYGETPEKAQAVLKRVESNGKHLLGLINDVLDLSKIEAGQLKLSLVDYSMKDLVYNVVSAVEPLATKKNLQFKVELPIELPVGRGDEKKLTQVLLNLAGNAIKFTDTGEVAIKATATNGAFSVAVLDTGPGISDDDQSKLFQQFQQADNSITKTKGGTGLGLAISKKIIELHGGNIAVESAVGRGSTFTFTLPVRVEQQAGPP
jgi:signal transduction histidine kinase